MQTLSYFINSKSKQLAYFVRAYLFHQTPYQELELFVWDVFEEWTTVSINPDTPYTNKELVFWHLIHQIKFWSDHHLKTDEILRKEILTYIEYLEGKGHFPVDCIGIRP